MVPSGLVITGGGSLTVGAVDTAKKIIGLPVRIGVPQGIVGLVDEVLYPQYATVVGLIFYGRNYLKRNKVEGLKDFRAIFRDFSFKGSFKKVVDLFKSFLP